MSVMRSFTTNDLQPSNDVQRQPSPLKVQAATEFECGTGQCHNATFGSSLVHTLIKNLSATVTTEPETKVVPGNDTIPVDDIEYYYFYKTEQLTFLWILFTMIVVGNSAVVAALMLSKNRKSRMNFFIMQLAIADLTVGLINVLTDIIWRNTVAFYAGNIVCKLIKFFQVLVTYSSTYVLVALSIDRYDAITHPMNFSGSWRRAKILVFLAWGLSAIFSVPAIFLNEEVEIRGHPQCWIDLEQWQWQMYITMVAMSLFFIPALIISACYSIIVYTIWTKSKLMAYPKLTRCSTMSKSSTCTSKSVSSSINDVDRKRASSRGIIPRAKIKTVKMTFVIIFVFIMCWSPYFLYDLLQVYGYIPINQTTIAISTFIQSLAPLNSAANPIIYCLFSTRICRNLRKLPLINWLAERLCTCCPSLDTPLPVTTCNQVSEYTNVTVTTRGSAQFRTLTLKSQPPTFVLKTHIVDKDTLEKDPKVLFNNSHV